MRFNGGTVDQNLRRRPTSLSQCAKQIDPHALRGPAHISIIECLPRAIFRGASTQRAPDFRTCTMPLITRRSSTRALPRLSVGRCGLIFENCAFVSQKHRGETELTQAADQAHSVLAKHGTFP